METVPAEDQTEAPFCVTSGSVPRHRRRHAPVLGSPELVEWTGVEGVTAGLRRKPWGPGEDLTLPGRVRKKLGKHTACEVGLGKLLGFATQGRDYSEQN